jgi:hypothetical protein
MHTWPKGKEVGPPLGITVGNLAGTIGEARAQKQASLLMDQDQEVTKHQNR